MIPVDDAEGGVARHTGIVVVAIEVVELDDRPPAVAVEDLCQPGLASAARTAQEDDGGAGWRGRRGGHEG